MRAVAPQRAQVVPAEGELVEGQQLVGARVRQLVPLELEEEQERLDLGPQLAAALQQGAALRVARVEREREHRVGARAAAEVRDRAELAHGLGQLLALELADPAAVALGERRGAVPRLAEKLLDARGTAPLDERLQVPGSCLEGFVDRAHGPEPRAPFSAGHDQVE